MEYQFTLKFMLGATGDLDEVVERLGAAGCDDALVGIGQPGRIGLTFTRDAESAHQAIVSALEAAKTAIPDAKLLEVAPDFVGLTDIAELVGVSRQNMRKLMLSHIDNFPLAIHEGSVALWHLFPILQWLRDHADYVITQPLLDVAHMAMQINLTREASQLESRVRKKVIDLVG